MRMRGRAIVSPLGGVLLAAGLAVGLSAALSACGGASASADRQAGQASQGGVAVPPAPAVALAAFQDMAREAICSETRNRLFVIDGALVLWDHAGACADASYEQKLFGATTAEVLCTRGDSIAGERSTCMDEKSRALFETIVKNLDKSDLGLGSAHKVEAASVPPKAGSVLPLQLLAKDSLSGVRVKKNVLIKDQAAWEKLWAEHGATRSPAPALPVADFNSQMLVGVFAGDTGDCRTIGVRRVVAGSASLKVEVEERALQTFQACPAIVTQPMQVVALARSDLPVEFVSVPATALPFTTLSQTSLSGVHEAREVVVKDAAAWQRLWQEHAPGTAAPAVDFSTSMVVGIFAGQGSPCYSSAIAGVSRGSDRIVVQRIDTVPPPYVACAMMVTWPAHLVAIERSELPVEFAARTEQAK